MSPIILKEPEYLQHNISMIKNNMKVQQKISMTKITCKISIIRSVSEYLGGIGLLGQPPKSQQNQWRYQNIQFICFFDNAENRKLNDLRYVLVLDLHCCNYYFSIFITLIIFMRGSAVLLYPFFPSFFPHNFLFVPNFQFVPGSNL